MERRSLGHLELTTTPLGLGLAALGRPGYITLGHGRDLAGHYDPEEMRRHAWAVLDTAWALGIRYFDAARSYGRGEEFLASWLARRRTDPARVTVGSKWGYTYTAGWQVDADVHEVKDLTRATLERQYSESIALLGDQLDLYQIHSATLSSGVLDRSDVLDALARLKSSGRGLVIGLTLSGLEQRQTLERALAIERDGRRLFDTVQATWNLLEPSLGDLLGAAARAGMGVIVKEALANGRLTERNDAPEFAPRLAVLAGQAARLGSSVDQVALAAALDQSWAHCVLSGATTETQLRSNAGALALTLDDTARAALRGLAQSPEEYWSQRANLRWQ